MVTAEINAKELISYTLKMSLHNIESLSKILLIPKKRLLHSELMTQKDLETLLKLKQILKK